MVVELQGPVMAVQVISLQGPTSPLRPRSLRLQDSLDLGIDPLKNQDSMLESIDSEAPLFEFSDVYGKNIQLLDERRAARRTQSFNQGTVCVSRPLCKGQSISVSLCICFGESCTVSKTLTKHVFLQIKIDEINPKWKGTIILGAVGSHLNSSHLPSSAILLRRPCWIFTHDYINIGGSKVQSNVAECLLKIQKDMIITLGLTHSGCLTLQMGEKCIEEIAAGLPHHVYPVFDLYGKCERISLFDGFDLANGTPINDEITMSTANLMNLDVDRNVPQCEKADLEVHEKETENSLPTINGSNGSGGAM